jgi:acetyl-CoA synthetase
MSSDGVGSTNPQSVNNFATLLKEDRQFAPDAAFRTQANWNDPAIYEQAAADPEAFWAQMAGLLDWFKPWDRILDWQLPEARWFDGATLNVCYNCVDRHVKTWRKNKAALIWEGEYGDNKTYTYQELYRSVNKCAAALKGLGVQKGDRVAIYMGMVPELVISLLACARIGAPHVVVFGGFSPQALKDRINDAGCKLLICADGAWRRGYMVPLKENAEKALSECPTVEKVLVVNRVMPAARVPMLDERDHWWHREMERCKGAVVEPEAVESEHPLFILYTSGTTGKPKGLLHTSGGFLTGAAATAKYVFDLKEDDTYWCAADIGWVTGHSYIVYGPLANGAAIVLYEGAPDYPNKRRFWEIIERYRVNILYTAPTAIRAFMKWGNEHPERHDLSSLRLLGSVGEPINPEAWIWYRENIGSGRCPVVDTWWQTETGSILITPLPGITTLKPGSATHPFPGIEAAVVDEEGKEVPKGQAGYLIIRKPWPSMARTIWGDPQRWFETYWAKFPGVYWTGDNARWDEDGYFWLLGRADDVINVAGHRIGTMEVESALVSHPAVAEAAVIGINHQIKGTAIAAFVTLRGTVNDWDVIDELRNHVADKIGAIARPHRIFITGELPKTRSGKIMRRLLRDIAEERVMGDVTTLADPAVLESIRKQYDDKE